VNRAGLWSMAVASREAHRSAVVTSEGPHPGLQWLARRRGQASGGEGRTAAVNLGVG
jgi:hypothetical protein